MTGILFNSPNAARHRIPQSILGNIAEDLDHGSSDDFEYEDPASEAVAVVATVEVCDCCIFFYRAGVLIEYLSLFFARMLACARCGSLIPIRLTNWAFELYYVEAQGRTRH